MTEKEKAKAYDEAIERAKELYGNGITEEIFPELKEDDTERIRKNCIHFLELQKQHHAATFEIEKCIDWLERQGKKSSWKPSKEEMDALYSLSYITNEYDEHKEDVITHLYQDLKREFFNDSSYENMFSLDNKEDDVRRRSTIQVLEYVRSLDAYNQYGKADIDKNIAWLEKQDEQKPTIEMKSAEESLGISSEEYNKIVDKLIYDEQKHTDKVEPKFKVGDKITNTFRKYVGASGSQVIISQITDNKYIFTDGSYIFISNQDSWELAPDKNPKFDPKTLNPFDKVLCKNGLDMWRCDLFSSYVGTYACPNVCLGGSYTYCIPYNDDTKHLVGTTDEAPKYYRYWEE